MSNVVGKAAEAARILRAQRKKEDRLPGGEQPQPINVHFKVGIRIDGELRRVLITQGEQEISLTTEQATSLMQELIRRFGPGDTSEAPK